ncbi:MAG: hypothetical protein DWQ31_08395 [Planctomycetota bacterium]|nr:MAG: hypothetical protein DWQ31_08395 [Planctomycetota bacterium]REJ93952.1 MAG: hypothetical protein DWQ35_09280 [Planctomycetota bacterium]
MKSTAELVWTWQLGLVLLLSACQDADPPPADAAATDRSGVSQGRVEPPDVPGHWRMVRLPNQTQDSSVEESRDVARLRTLGYVAGSRAPGSFDAVTVYDPAQSYAGLNFYVSAHAPVAILMDMKGEVLHRWELPVTRAWPDMPADQFQGETKEFWRRAYLFENGDVLAIFAGIGLIKVDRNSNLIWAARNGAHHDLEVLPSGDIYVLTRRTRLVPEIHPETPIRMDYISLLDSQGQTKREYSVLDLLERRPGGELAKIEFRPEDVVLVEGDLLHTNTLCVLDDRAAHLSPAFAPGNILVSMRNISMIAVLDLENEQAVWGLRSPRGDSPQGANRAELVFELQHDPQIVAGGNLLLFDNLGQEGRSTIWEFHPLTREVAWFYRGTEERPFFTEFCGTVQRLPNGNTLITESENGRAFEVSPEKEIVWEFYNPERAGEDGQFIAMIPELWRLPPDFPHDWADSAPAAETSAE